ncbi:mitochondrial inner membrane m-AAA protease component paraplegin-like [Babylonia areolata]|uniref:mitochondrial inner membrane m-AAA protease component paraplegin-like n=1 Tax=Babylonia areolata TaxID=304850 RepID=UPI003FD33B42
MEVFLCGRNSLLASSSKRAIRFTRLKSGGVTSSAAFQHKKNDERVHISTHFCSECDSRRAADFMKVLQHQQPNRLELQGVSALLKRSGIDSSHLYRLIGVPGRHFSTSGPPNNQQDRGRDEDDRNKDDKDKENQNEKIPLLPRLIFWFWLAFGVYTVLKMGQGEDSSSFRFISWNEFYHDMLAKGEVDAIIVRPDSESALIQLAEGAVIKGKKVDTRFYTLKIPDAGGFEEKVRKAESDLGLRPDQSVPIHYVRQSPWAPVIFMGIIAIAGFFLLRNLSSRVQLPNPTDMFANERKAKFMRVDVASKHGHGISFKDVAGLTEAKTEIMEFVDYLTSPQRFKELGAKVPRGALLLGPPGCGKTLLARAVATEAKVPFLAMAGSEFVEMLGGLGAARVRDLFKEARKRAPCIVYIDEIDAIGRKRTGGSFGSNMEEEHTLNQLLVEMDGMGTQEGVIMLAATNRADILDKALLRPGRFDRHIMIDLPTLIERRDIFNLYLGKLKLEQSPEMYSEKMAQMTPGMSGADISNVCNEAAIRAARDGKKIITASDFEYAAERVIAGVEKKTHLLAPTEKKVVAYHESGHALVGWMLKHTDALIRISIVPRTNSALGFAQYMPSDQKLYSSDELFERMCMALGGRAAESVIFNRVTTGAHDDLKKVTQMAYDQIQSFGMNENIGLLSFPTGSDSRFSRPFSKKMQATIDEEARALVSRAFHHTVKVLKDNKDKLDSMAHSLMEREVLTYEDIEALIGPPPHGEKLKIEPHGWEGIMPSNDHPHPPPPRRPKPGQD